MMARTLDQVVKDQMAHSVMEWCRLTAIVEQLQEERDALQVQVDRLTGELNRMTNVLPRDDAAPS